MMRKVAWLGLVVLLPVLMTGCRDSSAPRKVSLEKREATREPAALPAGSSLRFAVGGMITPREGFAYYRKFLDYIGEKVGLPVVYIDREKYSEINLLLQNGGVDVAFVCSGPYVDGRTEFGLELLAAPQAYGKPVYYSYLIVPKDSAASRFEDLRGKVFAFTDPDSNTGRLVPEYVLGRMNETPERFFQRTVYTYKHDASIKAVAQKVVDGAAVDSLVWEYANKKSDQYASRTKIIWKSPPYGIPPVVVRPGLDPALKTSLRKAFLEAHLDPAGRALLQDMMIDRFVAIDDRAYDSVRQMKAWVDQRVHARKGGAPR